MWTQLVQFPYQSLKVKKNWDQLNLQECSEEAKKNSSSSVHRKLNLVNDKSLECIKPFYTNNRNKSLSIHQKDLQKAQFDRKERKTCNPNLNKS